MVGEDDEVKGGDLDEVEGKVRRSTSSRAGYVVTGTTRHEPALLTVQGQANTEQL